MVMVRLELTASGFGRQRSIFQLSYITKTMVGIGLEPMTSGFSDRRCYHTELPNPKVSVAGLEPATSGFVDRRSVFHLSYTDKKQVRMAGLEPA